MLQKPTSILVIEDSDNDYAKIRNALNDIGAVNVTQKNCEELDALIKMLDQRERAYDA